MNSQSVDRSHQKNSQTHNSSPETSEDLVSFRDWIGIVAVSLAAFTSMFALLSSAPAVNAISGYMGVALPQGAWVIYAYTTAQAIAIPLAGSLSKAFSVRRYFLASACLFVVCSWLGSQATTLPMMLVIRFGQGFAGGGLNAIALTTIVTKLPAAKRPIGLILYSMSLALAPGISPVIGGWITYRFSWHYIFYLAMIPGFLIMAGAWYGLKSQPMQLRLLKRQDWLGICLFIAGFSSFEYVIQEGTLKNWFTYQPIVYCTVISLVCVLLFLIVEFTHQEPLLNLRLLRNSSFAVSILVTMLYGFGQGEALIILVFYLIPILNYNAIEIGETLAAYGLPQIITTPLVPKMMQRFDRRLIISIGLIGYAISFWMNVPMTHLTAMKQLVPSLVVRGLAQPLIVSPLSSLVTSQVKKKDSGDASIFFNIALSIAMAIGIAFLKEFQNLRSQFHSSHINESVSLYNSTTLQQIDNLTQYFLSQGGGENLARNRAISTISGLISRESGVMGFADCYYVAGWVLMVGAGLVFLVRKPRSK